MKHKYIIIINEVANESQVDNFIKAVSQDFINIRGGENIILIMTDKEMPPTEIHKIVSKRMDTLSFLVVEPNKWYGGLYDEAWQWLKEKFPETKWVHE